MGVLRDAERAGLCRSEKIAGAIGVAFGNHDLDGAEAVNRQAVRVAKRFAAFGGVNASGLEKRANLLCVNLSACDEHPAQVRIHQGCELWLAAAAFASSARAALRMFFKP